MQDERLADGRARLLRREHGPERTVRTGIGPVPVQRARRIISTTADARLFALDADTGRLCPGFGQNGYVSLKSQLGPTPPGFHFISSQPMVAGGKVILGGWIYDNISEAEPSGVVRAYDVATGALAWAWDLGRTPANAPLRPGESYTPGTPNAWGSYTADEALGLVYLPLGNATPDYSAASGGRSTRNTVPRSSRSTSPRGRSVGTTRRSTTTCGTSTCRSGRA